MATPCGLANHKLFYFQIHLNIEKKKKNPEPKIKNVLNIQNGRWTRVQVTSAWSTEANKWSRQNWSSDVATLRRCISRVTTIQMQLLISPSDNIVHWEFGSALIRLEKIGNGVFIGGETGVVYHGIPGYCDYFVRISSFRDSIVDTLIRYL